MRRLAIVILAFISAASAHAQTTGVYFSSNAWMASRSAAPGSSAPVVTMPYSKINVCNTTSSTPPQCTTAAIIYSDAALTQVIQQPITADGQGNFGFYIGTGQYKFNIFAATGGIVASYPFTATSGGVAFTGGTLTQPLILAGAPTTSNGAATKAYVDANGGSVNGIKTATVAAASGLAASTSGSTVTVAPDSMHVIPVNSGSSTTYLNGAGAYTTPPGGVSAVAGSSGLTSTTSGSTTTVLPDSSHIIPVNTGSTSTYLNGAGAYATPPGGASGPTNSLLANNGGTATGTSALGIQSGTTGVIQQNATGNSVTTTVNGAGALIPYQLNVIDPTVAINLQAGRGHLNLGFQNTNAAQTAGIAQGQTNYINCLKFSGDCALLANFLNYRTGGIDPSREGIEGFAMKLYPMGDVSGTIGSFTAGATSIPWTPTNNCAIGHGISSCDGGDGILLPASTLYTGTLTANTDPSSSSYGTMSLTGTGTLTPTPYAAVTSGNIPALGSTDSAITGTSITVTLGSFTNGTPASSGIACLTMTTEIWPECSSYTLSGSTLTMLHHRYEHLDGNGTVFFMDPNYVETPSVTSVTSGRLVMTVLGVISSSGGNSVIAYTNTEDGHRATGIVPAVGSVANVYRGVHILGPVGSGGVSGQAPLVDNNTNMGSSGATVSEVGVPAFLYNGMFILCNPGFIGTANNSNCRHTIMQDGLANAFEQIDFSPLAANTNLATTLNPALTTNGILNPLAAFINISTPSPGAYGTYRDFAHITTLPTHAMFEFDACAGGDPSPTCANSPDFFTIPGQAFSPSNGYAYFTPFSPPPRFYKGLNLVSSADGTNAGDMTNGGGGFANRPRYNDGSAVHSLAYADDSTKGMATLVAGTVTVTTSAACTPGSACNYQLANCGKNASTVIGLPSIASATAGTSFVITSITAAAATATADVSNVCWRIN